MTEHLIIKNFGPIREVNLTIRKINILIGEQGAGKSTLAKVLSIFNSIEFLSDFTSFDAFLYEYNIKSYLKPTTYFKYTSSDLKISFVYNKGKFRFLKKAVAFETLVKRYERLRKKINSLTLTSTDSLKKELRRITEVVKYIPTERIFIPIVSNSLFSLLSTDTNIPQYILKFGELYELSKNRIGKIGFDFLSIRYEKDQEMGDTLVLKNNHKMKLSESASGFQSIVPLLISIEYNNIDSEARFSLTIEEPELNLYPITQYELMKFIINKTINIEKLTLTTHSPYVLSSLNNLMFAFITGKDNPRKTAQIIARKYWINPSQVSAYKLNIDGTAKDIVDKKLNQIKIEEIDEISEQLSNDWHKLAEIKYGK